MGWMLLSDDTGILHWGMVFLLLFLSKKLTLSAENTFCYDALCCHLFDTEKAKSSNADQTVPITRTQKGIIGFGAVQFA